MGKETGHSVERIRLFLAARPPLPPLFIRTAQSTTTNVREARSPGLLLISFGNKGALINSFNEGGKESKAIWQLCCVYFCGVITVFACLARYSSIFDAYIMANASRDRAGGEPA